MELGSREGDPQGETAMGYLTKEMTGVTPTKENWGGASLKEEDNSRESRTKIEDKREALLRLS